ncbi:MAG: glutamine--fructose-6-phosphate transaminase (isomerizing), partial [Gemmatimonadetes bacterium]|nr:glutamine--fructose-6-phosphate transaminase (isomerizing) [Gemmatimonadota bacterium]
MCGIVGYTGSREATPLIMEGLKRLEYRGYDSAGLAVVRDGKLTVEKTAGKLSALEHRLASGGDHAGTLALGHTRWATHGAPTETNAHPHLDVDGTIAVVHNGIIENATALRGWLTERGHTFRSETDTEVLVHLIRELFTDSLEAAVTAALRRVEGTYGLGVISTHEPNTLVAARSGSPLLLALGEGENFIASDAAAVVKHTRSVVYLDDGEVAVLTPDDYHIVDLDKTRVQKSVTVVDWDLDTIERGGHAHFMIKEILEQADAITDTMRGRLLEDEGSARLGGIDMSDEQLLEIDRVVLTACGTSWHAALIGEYMLEELARIPAEVEYASEFRYRTPLVDSRT